MPTYAIDVGRPLDLEGTEWLLTNGLGGFAMGTALGAPTRRYHGLLVAALSPPVQREVILHSVVDEVVLNEERRVALTPFRFRGAEPGPPPLVRFEKDLSCRWRFRVGGVGGAEVIKEVFLHPARNAVTVRYEVRAGAEATELVCRPLVAMRDAHALLASGDPAPPVPAGVSERGLTVVRGAARLEVWSERAAFRVDPQWWYGFEYRCERERGFDCHEDLYSPGAYSVSVAARVEGRVEITAWIGERPRSVSTDQRERAEELERHAGAALEGCEKADAPSRDALRRLTFAASDFVVHRGEKADSKWEKPARQVGCTIIAGYPWFTDWGRDAMIALPGLLLSTGRDDEALAVLSTLARRRRRGLIPNTFSDQTGEPQYNTVDASLWFIHAACEYLKVSGMGLGFDHHLRNACMDIVEAYAAGTDYGIRVDDDGLVTAGDPSTQLTWMDAKRDGVVFTPRHGKAVEINALWIHGLTALAAAIGNPSEATRLRGMAQRAAASFARQFWNSRADCLYDVLQPEPGGGWTPNEQIRPNQIFAVSLEGSPLTERQQRAVVQTVRTRLSTPHGLRTLDPTDPAYRGRFTGPIFERDGAYHNGTAWPWLMGPFAEAVLRIGRFSPAARADAKALLRPLVARLDAECLGQLPEVFDGDDTPDAPQRPGGCPAQAWSVAEVLRVLSLACSGEGRA